MTRLAKLDLNQVNQQLDRIDSLHARLAEVEKQLSIVSFQTSQVDPTHARPTFNNLIFTWTGGAGTLSWLDGWVRDKNALAPTNPIYNQTPSYKPNAVQAPITHNIPVYAGTLGGITASTYYWIGWNTNNHKMYALTDVTKLYTQKETQVICQVFTGTAGQTGPCGGGGSQGTSDLSGARYKLF